MCADYRLQNEPSKPAAVSLFSGGGGLDMGAERAGFDTRAAVEIERYACEALRRNQHAPLGDGTGFLASAEILEQSVTDTDARELLRRARLRKGEAALLIGGPPCVSFSVAGRRRGLQDETGRLFEHYARIVRGVQPAGIIYENVKGLLTAPDQDGRKGGAFEAIHSALEAAGYALSWRLVNAADYGVPQFRERVIILGLRGSEPPTFPEPTHHDPDRPAPLADPPLLAWRTVRDAIGDMPPAALPGEEPRLPNHIARRHGPEVVASFAETPPGQRNQKFKRDRLRWDRPSKVIRAQGKPKSDGSGQKNSSHQPLHPEEHRQLTPRECARIQTFPDWYWLPDTFLNGYRIIGDAVPPALAETMARAMLDVLGLDMRAKEPVEQQAA